MLNRASIFQNNNKIWVIPRENKKDGLAQLWNSFENVNIGNLFSKLG